MIDDKPPKAVSWMVQIMGMRAWKPAVMALLAANTALTMIQVGCLEFQFKQLCLLLI